MMPHTQGFDGDLQMFRDMPQAVNLAQLRFQRWLIEQGRAEHPLAGPSAGELADTVDAGSGMGEAAGSLEEPLRGRDGR
jgi:hypothetical protein